MYKNLVLYKVFKKEFGSARNIRELAKSNVYGDTPNPVLHHQTEKINTIRELAQKNYVEPKESVENK